MFWLLLISTVGTMFLSFCAGYLLCQWRTSDDPWLVDPALVEESVTRNTPRFPVRY